MSHKIDSKATKINDAYGVTVEHLDAIADTLATIYTLTDNGELPAGFVAKRVQEVFSKDDLEIIATMFIVNTINEQKSKECDCDQCKSYRGESPSDDEVIDALRAALGKQFPGMETKIIKLNNPNKGKTDC